jgi:outer membrane receptor protein involved in Fe transport
MPAPLLAGERVLASAGASATASDADSREAAGANGDRVLQRNYAAVEAGEAANGVAPTAEQLRLANIPSVQPYSRPQSGLSGLSSGIEAGAGGGAEGAAAGASSLDVGALSQSIPVSVPVDPTLAITESSSTDTVRAQRRSPVSFDPRVRGFRQGQLYTQADGALWRPAREDLDTMLSKIAPNSITGIHVINGPYGVTYGPGFAFIDVQTADTPRYDCGYEAHNTMGLTYRTNGNQWYGYETAEGGNENYGFRLGYGNRNGIDYEAGNGEAIPSSYLNQDFLAQFGYNFNPFQRLEFRFQHLDQTDTEYFGKFFDLDALVTDGFNLRLVDEDPAGPWSKFVVEGWYNRTDFHGGTGDPFSQNGKTSTIDRVERALERALLAPTGDIVFQGTTNGFLSSTGARSAMTFGDEEDAHFVVGGDVRVLEQRTIENFSIGSLSGVPLIPELENFGTNQPLGRSIDPGAFAELTLPWRSYWKTIIGSRVDYLHTEINEGEQRADTQLPIGGDLSQDDVLYAFFLNNVVELDENWTLDAGFGHAHRPPTLTERYADGVFLGLFQNGFTRVIGNPELNPERMWQVDIGLKSEYDRVRTGIRGFYSWILDYNTYEVLTVPGPAAGTGPFGAQLVRGAETNLATIGGFELDGAYDWNDNITLFGNLAYIEGRDQDIGAPMTGIYPLEGRIGFRMHDASKENRWGLEFFGRIVDDQDRLGALRSGATGTLSAQQVEAATPGFTVFNLRGYWAASKSVRFTGGVENLFDRNYLEHLDLRLPASGPDNIPELRLLAPGITPYAGMEWTF